MSIILYGRSDWRGGRSVGRATLRVGCRACQGVHVTVPILLTHHTAARTQMDIGPSGSNKYPDS